MVAAAYSGCALGTPCLVRLHGVDLLRWSQNVARVHKCKAYAGEGEVSLVHGVAEVGCMRGIFISARAAIRSAVYGAAKLAV